MDLKKMAKLISKQLKKKTTTSGDPRVRNRRDFDPDQTYYNVEGRPGMPEHFQFDDADMPYERQREFNTAHQGLLQNDDGSPLFDSMGLDMDAKGESPGLWKEPRTGEAIRNPTTEYRHPKAPTARQNLAGDYMGAVMGQDGVGVSDLQPGLSRGPGFASIKMPPGSPVTMDQRVKNMEASGLSLDDQFFGAPGSQGDVIGSMEPIPPADQMRWKRAAGPGAENWHRPEGDSAYRGAVDFEYKSVADNMGRLKDRFDDEGLSSEFDSMLRQTAKQAPRAYREMEGISGSKPNENFQILWDHLNANPDKPAGAELKKLIDDNIISMDDLIDAMMGQQQPEGLLA